ncbi:MAG: AAA family ATPase, partial [Chloroflexi bacterium]|nr:AAA family ATPase [Chloroflexota bacterium]
MASPFLSVPLVGAGTFQTPIVGRLSELELLRDLYDAVASHQGNRLVLISGEGGVGKSRLAREVGCYAETRGGVFLEVTYRRDGVAPFGPWLEALRARLRIADSSAATRSRLAPLVNHFESLGLGTGGEPRTPALAAASRRAELFDAIVEEFAVLSRDHPVVLVVNDLQRAPGLGLLTHLARTLGATRVLIVGTYQAQALREQPNLWREWGELNRERLAIQVELQRFRLEETARMIESIFDAATAALLAQPVQRRTRGNAFFVEEVLRSLAATGAVTPNGTTWEVSDPTNIQIPASIRLVIEDRVARLGDQALEILRQAAVLGTEVSFPVLQALTGRSEDELVGVIERAVVAQILVDRSTPNDERYAFVDDHVQEVLYGGLAPPRRRRWHRAAAEIIEAHFREQLDRHVEELARHYTAAGVPEKIAEYAFRAGDYNEQLFNWPRALDWYATAVAVLGNLPDGEATRRRHVDALLAHVAISYSGESAERILARLDQAEALARTLPGPDGTPGGDLARLARVHFWRSRPYLYRTPYRESIGLLQQSLLAAQESGDDELLAMSSGVIGWLMARQGQFGKAGPFLALTLPALERAGNWREWIDAAGYVGLALAAGGEYAAGLAKAQGALARALDTGNRTGVSLSHLYLAGIHLFGGDLAAALTAARTGADSARAQSNDLLVRCANVLIAWTESRLGNHRVAVVALRLAQRSAEARADRLVMTDWLLAIAAEVWLGAGEIATAATLAQQAIARAKDDDCVFAEGIAHRVRAESLAAQGAEWTRVAEHLAASRQALETAGATTEAARTESTAKRLATGDGAKPLPAPLGGRSAGPP